ncbi:MAG: discoidin domain-containing protein, partial [Deltaproteobacteria bacterium]|nr:discoidin domain-containing protein [Deltaproteobacteria bacterium]
GMLGADAVDGNLGTRWASAFQIDPQEIIVNLNQVCTINSVVLYWEAAGGASYTIDASMDGTTWTNNIATVTGNTTTGVANPLTYTPSGGATTAQYVRVRGTTRILAQYGYSLWEFQVMGTPGGGGSAPVINSALTKSGTVGTALTYNITAANTPTSYGATGLPAGLSVNTTTGAITGTPTAAGTTNSTITATNASGTDSETLVFTITSGGDTNLALGQPATATSFQVGNIVANGNDASLTSRWAAVNGTFPQSWQVDLGPGKVLSRVDIMWLNPTTRAYRYRIETSTDDINYTPAFDNTGNTTNGNTSNNITATARYVRITVTGSSSGGFASFFDVKVFGH